MDLPVKLNETLRTGRVAFAEVDNLGFLDNWKTCASEQRQDQRRQDAVEIAQAAVARFLAHSAFLPYANNVDSIREHIETDAKCEVGCLVLLRCDWFPASEIVGICHFRRSWSNRIILDYLASHPLIANAPSEYPYIVGGVGLALLYFVSTVAKRYACDAIWGEATAESCSYYERHFRLESVKDLIFVPRERYLQFIDLMDRKDVTAAIVRDEMYNYEKSTPPFVGSKTAVFGASRKLVYRFMRLPEHIQNEIAVSLDLSNTEDSNRSTEEQVSLILHRAKEKGKLADLWKRVESNYPDGEPYNNPFLA